MGVLLRIGRLRREFWLITYSPRIEEGDIAD